MFTFVTANTPEMLEISSKGLMDFLDAAAQKGIEFHSLLVLRHGQVAVRMNWSPYDDQTPHVLFSLSKSFCSAAAGFAVAEGLLQWDTKVLDILPDAAPEDVSEGHQKITLHSLLCMGSGLDPRSDSTPENMKDDWATHVLSFPVLHEPGTAFHYNSLGTYLVSAMVQKVTGQNIRDYLMPRLFEPLGIPKPEWDFSPQRICCGGWGLHLSSDSIARFGQCLLQHGMWQGKQVLPEGWVQLASSKHIENGNGGDNEWGQGYGYQFWRTRGNRYRGDGMFGQACMIDEQKDVCVAITCGTNDMGGEFALLHDYIFPAVDAPAGTAEEQAALQTRLQNLAYPFPADDGSGTVQKAAYSAQEGSSLAFEQADADTLRVVFANQHSPAITLLAGRGTPHAQTLPADNPGSVPLRYLCGYGFENGKLHLVVRTPDGPFTLDAVFTFTDTGLTVEAKGVGIDLGATVFGRI